MSHDQTIGRFAPTPSGYMHAGNILCALLAYLSAKSKGGKFIVRIEDLDKPRCSDNAAQAVLQVLYALGLKSDEPIIYQSARTAAYTDTENRLRRNAKLYPCFCTRAELHAATAPHGDDGELVYSGACRNLSAAELADLSSTRRPCLRIQVPNDTIRFIDGLCGEYSQNLATAFGDFILKRSDGIYAYQLAVVVDDGASEVTEVVRGIDLLSSTPRQIFLQRLLGLPQPQYYHIPLVCGENGRRLSKRMGDSAEELLKRHTPDEIIGMLAHAAGLLPDFRPATPDELVKTFDWKSVRTESIVIPDNF